MPNPKKLLFDECVGAPLVVHMRGVIGLPTDIVLAHVIPMGFGSMNDDVWIPKIATDGWLVVTNDRGSRKKAGKGEKLPIVCAAYRVSYVALSPTVGDYNSLDKYRVIMEMWDSLVACTQAPRGTAFTLKRTSDKWHHVIQLKKAAPEDPGPSETQAQIPLTD